MLLQRFLLLIDFSKIVNSKILGESSKHYSSKKSVDCMYLLSI